MLVLLASCTSNPAPINNQNQSTDGVMTIVWDNYTYTADKPEDSRIARVLNERFNVVMTSQIWPHRDFRTVRENQIKNGTLTDIFGAGLY